MLVVGSAEVPQRDRDAFVALKLEPGWELQRRTYEERALSHLYFASPTPLEQLIARAGGTQTYRPSAALRPGSQAQPAADLENVEKVDSDFMATTNPGRVVALQVIPFDEPGEEGP